MNTLDTALSDPPTGPFYSQYHEDFILAYLFAGQASGRYLDVGANDPNHCSVTRYFYQKGWRGVNIEPNPKFKRVYAQYRTEDLNLCIGIGTKKAMRTLYLTSDFPESANFDVAGLSTLNKEAAQKHQREGFRLGSTQIQVAPLHTVIDEYQLTSVDFMNIDVEGAEKDVLLSTPFESFRPKVLLVEAMEPLSMKTNYEAWESILLNHNYEFALFDGLNRYYLDRSHRSVLPRFADMARFLARQK